MIMLFIFPHVYIAKFGVFVNDQLTQKLPLIPRTLITRGSIKNNQEWFVVSKFLFGWVWKKFPIKARDFVKWLPSVKKIWCGFNFWDHLMLWGLLLYFVTLTRKLFVLRNCANFLASKFLYLMYTWLKFFLNKKYSSNTGFVEIHLVFGAWGWS